MYAAENANVDEVNVLLYKARPQPRGLHSLLPDSNCRTQTAA